MKVYKEVDNIFDLSVWSGAQATIDKIEELGLEDELMHHLEEVFSEGATETDVNDYLRLESEYIFECLGVIEDEDEDEDEEEEEEDDDYDEDEEEE